jgi:tol-pal system protein YbgF
MISLREKTLAMALGAVVGMLPAAVAATRLESAPEGQAQTAMRANTAFKVAQLSETDLLMRLDRLEEQVRQLTGAVEQLQYHNQQLEQQLRRTQEIPEPRSGAGRAPGGSGGLPASGGMAAGDRYPPPPPGGAAAGDRYPPPAPGGMAASDRYPPAPPGPGSAESYPPPPPGQRQAGVFDPSQNPYAPGAPRSLGTMPAGGQGDPAMGAPGGRAAGAPLDLSTLSDAQGGPYPGGAPSPPPASRNPNGGERLVMAPSASPKDEYDLAYGYVLRKDYALAEESFRAFLRTYPNDRLAADAHYWLGEALFQRQQYRDAAESFLTVSTRYETAGKAPEAMVRLGQSLAALGEKTAACGTFAEIGRKYPRAGNTVKQMSEREQKRVGC